MSKAQTYTTKKNNHSYFDGDLMLTKYFATIRTQALFGCLARVARTIPEKKILHAWSTKRSLFAKLFHGWV